MDNIKQWLKENLSEERYKHVIATSQTAKDMAKEFGIDENKAELAGLLHDCAKEYSTDEMVKIIKDNNLDVSADELKAKKVLHAPVSAYLAKNLFKIEDEEILSAIRFHTIGKITMTTFEKIIYLADKLEPVTRIEEYFENLRQEYAKSKNLDKTMLLCSKMTIKSLVDRNLPINYDTIALYNDLLKTNEAK